MKQRMKRRVQMPDFAGTALVDILANGLAMLIIVIALSIAARGEHEQRTASKVEEVETVMSRRFSTSLVLNSLAASRPAQLHDYQISPLDQEYDPDVLPIIELHRDFVREFYSGAIWPREQLLREPNAMDGWLSGFSTEQKRRLRTDVYDIAQFYLAMSILRDHGIAVQHWHFLAGGLDLAQAGNCSPAVSAQDCDTGSAPVTTSDLPALTQGDGGGSEIWPPGFAEGNGQQAEDNFSPFPSGATPGPLLSGAGGFGSFADAENLGGSFPNARPGARSGAESQSSGLLGAPEGESNGRIRFRLSSPESLRQDSAQSFDWGDTEPTVERVLSILFDFIGKLQATLDAGASPSAQLANFEMLMNRAFSSPLVLDEQTRALVDTLVLDVFQNLAEGLPEDLSEDLPEDLVREFQPPGAAGHYRQLDQQLEVIPLEFEERAHTALVIEPNRRLQQIAVGQARHNALPLPEITRPVLRLNTHPDVWRGLSLPLEKNAILLLPPKQQRPNHLRWRAVAYIAPKFDDFIIGFVDSAIDGDGRLVVQAEDNRVRLGGRPLLSAHREPGFGTRSWLVASYALLMVCLLGFVLLVRRLTMERRK